MDIINLPQDLPIKEATPIQLYDYQVSTNQVKNKINLTKNVFSFLVSGTKEVITYQNPIKINKAKFLIIRSGHFLMTENLSSANNIYRSILLFFSDEMLFQFLEKHQIFQKPASNKQFISSCDYNEYIRSFVKSLLDIQKLKRPTQHKLLQVKFEEIMLYLIETKGPDFLLFLIGNKDNKSRSLIQVVENNKLNKLSLKELSFLSNRSISTFKREFEKHFQESPIKWFQQKRLDHAAFLLKNNSKRPSEVYQEVGYESLSNFIQAFKTKFGITPKQYQLTK